MVVLGGGGGGSHERGAHVCDAYGGKGKFPNVKSTCTEVTHDYAAPPYVQRYPANKKQPPPRTLQKDYLGFYVGPRGGG